MTSEKLIKEITSLMDNSDNIHARVNSQEKITGNLIYLAELETKALADYKNAYANRRIAEASYIHQSDESATKAKEIAPSECKAEREVEVKAEIEYESIKLFRQSMWRHLDASMQKTSHLKWEAKKAENQ